MSDENGMISISDGTKSSFSFILECCIRQYGRARIRDDGVHIYLLPDPGPDHPGGDQIIG